MFAAKENPRYNIVSVRITDDERAVLDQISRKSLKTISEIIRDAMQLATPVLYGFYQQHGYCEDYRHDAKDYEPTDAESRSRTL